MSSSLTSKLSLLDRLALPNSSVTIPRLGFGVYKAGFNCTNVCSMALGAGFRLFDSADLYDNAHLVHKAFLRSGLDRRDVFLTTKVGSPLAVSNPSWITEEMDQEEVYQSARKSVATMAGDEEDSYVDLLLIHVPGPSYEHRKKLWLALERLYKEGKAKSIGVSNYRYRHFYEMSDYATIWPPSVNQIELHPWCQQRDLVAYCREEGIVIQAYGALSGGKRLHFHNLGEVAFKHNKTPAQVLIRYSLQKGWVPLVGSGDEYRIRENADVFGFELDEADMRVLDAMDMGNKGARFRAHVA